MIRCSLTRFSFLAFHSRVTILHVRSENNYAFIDAQNLHVAVRHLGWAIDFPVFRKFLLSEYSVQRAYLFIGFREEYTDLYSDLQAAGFILVLKPTIKARDGTVKGNCDADLVLQAMIDLPDYDKAVIITGDGDFASLVRYLKEQRKLSVLLAPDKNRYSGLLETAAGEQIAFLSDERTRLAMKKEDEKKTPAFTIKAIAPKAKEHPDAPAPAPAPAKKSAKPRRRGRRGGRGRGRSAARKS